MSMDEVYENLVDNGIMCLCCTCFSMVKTRRVHCHITNSKINSIDCTSCEQACNYRTSAEMAYKLGLFDLNLADLAKLSGILPAEYLGYGWDETAFEE